MSSWWRSLWRRVAEWRKWRAIERAERLVWAHGYGVYHRGYVDEAFTRVSAVRAYAGSGRLRRGWHPDKRVHRDTADVAELLYAARRLAVRSGPVHIGAVVVGVLAGLAVEVLARSGTRSW